MAFYSLSHLVGKVIICQGIELTAVFIIQVKADRGEVDASDDTIKKMQQETAQSAEAERKQ